MSRPDYQQRVIDERNELNERAVKLASFIASEHFAKIDAEQAGLLQQQYTLQIALIEVLDRRIHLFDA